MFNSIWYDSLTKPFLNPPAWVFTPVWIILYGTLLISIMLYAVTITKEKKMCGYVLFIVHMIFNLLWSPIFFYLHRIDIALSILLLMDVLAILFIYKFFKVSKIAGVILFPYFLWLMFATYLNFQFWRLN